MSRKSLEAKKLALAGVTALAALGVTSTPASAAFQKTLNYTCSYPIIGVQPLKVDINAEIPAQFEVETRTPPFKIDVNAFPGGDTYGGLRTIGASKITGTSRATTTITQGGGAKLSPSVPITLDEFAVPTTDPGPGNLKLTAKGETPRVNFTELGPAKINVDSISLTLRAFADDGTPIDVVDEEFAPDTDNDPFTLNIVCKNAPLNQDTLLATVNIIPKGGTGDTTAPTVPGTGSATAITTSGANISWGASTDEAGGSGLKGYEYSVNGGPAVAVTGTSATLSGLTPDANQTVTVVAVDVAGNKSAAQTITFKTEKPPVSDTTPPSAPTNVTSSNVAATTATVSWTAATDASGIKNYDVSVNGSVVATVTGTSADLTGLAPKTLQNVSVKARDNSANANVGAAGTTSFTTTEQTQTVVPYSYTLAGSATLKNLTKGTLPLSGNIAAKLVLQTGAIEADLTLNKTAANLTALGILPVRAEVAFVSTAKTTGTLINGVLKTNSKVRIKLPKVTAFGIQLAGGSNCQTRSVSSIDLRSTQAQFLPTKGGPIAGSFSISNLSGCGFLEGIVSPLTSGSGNTIALNLTPVTK